MLTTTRSQGTLSHPHPSVAPGWFYENLVTCPRSGCSTFRFLAVFCLFLFLTLSSCGDSGCQLSCCRGGVCRWTLWDPGVGTLINPCSAASLAPAPWDEPRCLWRAPQVAAGGAAPLCGTEARLLALRPPLFLVCSQWKEFLLSPFEEPKSPSLLPPSAPLGQASSFSPATLGTRFWPRSLFFPGSSSVSPNVRAGFM